MLSCVRAWKLCGMALRSSLAMALHLRNENPHLPAAWKSVRYHVWWSLVTLEVTLCVITGRPLNIIRGFCTAPLIDPRTCRQYLNLDELAEVQLATVNLSSPKSMWTFRTSHGPISLSDGKSLWGDDQRILRLLRKSASNNGGSCRSTLHKTFHNYYRPLRDAHQGDSVAYQSWKVAFGSARVIAV
jgi:hypothetical protein